MKFNFKIEDVEVRIRDKHSLSDGEYEVAEIVKWEKGANGQNCCYTLAYWIKGNEGYDLKFVGKRPFDVDFELFMKLAKQGQQALDDVFNYKQE